MRFNSFQATCLLFFLSGAAGLIYEIVWSRQLVLIFGSTTNSVVATISAFLGGLALGSLVLGRLADHLSSKQLIILYSLLEAGIGLTASLTLILLPLIQRLYALVSDGSSVTFLLLLSKFFLSVLIMLLPTILMGGTLPLLVRFLQSQRLSVSHSLSWLYAVNTFGAVTGVLLAAFVLIELLGLTNTLMVAVLVNLIIAFLAGFLPVSPTRAPIATAYRMPVLSGHTTRIIFSYFLSGLVAIAYEVIWTRILTPTVGTFIYAFAIILALYLLGLALGSLFYPHFSRFTLNKDLIFAVCQLGIGFFALGSVYLTSNLVSLSGKLMVLLVILPATIFMGLAFPAAVAAIGQDKYSGQIVGLTYFANTLGSVIGGFLASFFFIPFVGSSQSLLVLSLVNFLLAIIFTPRLLKLAPAILIVLGLWLFVFKRFSLYPNEVQWRINWAKEKGIDYVFAEDEVASVFGYHDRKMNDYNLFIDGVPTTGKVGETKLMAHIPILLHPNPENILIIAFGMGTTYRSSLLHDLTTDVVELVPSIPPLMPLFHQDANQFLDHPQGRIIINDGRNYVFLTKKTYDIVTIDPPPPFNAAGTTVLYSQEFYQDIVQKLKPNGIVSQWLWFGSREDDIKMAAKSFLNVFPYVVVFQSPRASGGFFLEGSLSPINLTAFKSKTIHSQVIADLKENYPEFTPGQFSDLIIGNHSSLSQWVGNLPPITDDQPRTEYFLLRHSFTRLPSLVNRSLVELLK